MTLFKKTSAIILSIALILSLAGCSDNSDSSKQVKIKTVEVSTVDEFLDAIKSDTTIKLKSGTYNLTDSQTYGVYGCSDTYSWETHGIYGEYELEIEDVNNLTIIGDGAEIVTEPRSANVLSFDHCDNLHIDNITAGHTRNAHACEGGVLSIEDCYSVTVENCALYGCGTIGIIANDCKDMSIASTEVYECSGAGLSISECGNISVCDISIHDCGKEEQAYSAFSMYDVQGFSLAGGKVYNNSFDSLIDGTSLTDISFDNLEVSENRFDSVFLSQGDVKLDNLKFEKNIINRWFGDYYSDDFITIDGRILYKESLSEMYEDQLSSSGIGTVEVEEASIDRSGTKAVHVKTADEFIDAIDSDTTIYIDVPQINLTDAASYGKSGRDMYEYPDESFTEAEWVDVYDGCQLVITNVKNLHIVGGEIITGPRYANVLSFYYCDNISLDGVKVGHSPEEGSCCGGVLYFASSDSIIVNSCDLYGCGILGVACDSVKGITVQNTYIHDCSFGACSLSNSSDAAFINCQVERCEKDHVSLYNCDNFSWDGKLMDANSSFNIY